MATGEYENNNGGGKKGCSREKRELILAWKNIFPKIFIYDVKFTLFPDACANFVILYEVCPEVANSKRYFYMLMWPNLGAYLNYY